MRAYILYCVAQCSSAAEALSFFIFLHKGGFCSSDNFPSDLGMRIVQLLTFEGVDQPQVIGYRSCPAPTRSTVLGTLQARTVYLEQHC